MEKPSNVSAIVTGSNFRCPVCAKIGPRYNSIVICCINRDRTICIDCAGTIWQAIEQLHKDDKGEEQ
jgi:hypothetical protein